MLSSLIKLSIVVCCSETSFVRADGCGDICTRFPGTCGTGGSYCKDGRVCHDLFWANSEHTILCNHAQAMCPEKDPLRCDDVGRFAGNAAGITPASRVQPSTSRPVTVSTARPSSSAFSAARRVVPLVTTAVPRTTAPAPARSGPLPGTQGITNLGAMCYFSSILQPLLHSSLFRETVLSAGAPALRSSAGARVVAETAALTQRMWFPEEADLRALDTSSIIESMRLYTSSRMFVIGTADDSAWAVREYIAALLHGSSLVYGPLLQTRVRTYQQCLGPTMCVPGPLVEDHNMIIVRPNTNTDILRLIRDQFQAGIVPGHACTVCGSQVPGVARTPTIVRGAQVLIVVLERASPSIRVEIPAEINLTADGGVASEDGILRYRLVGIARHHGDHYTSEFRHPDSGDWYSADDSRVVRLGSAPPSLTGTSSRVVVYERM